VDISNLKEKFQVDPTSSSSSLTGLIFLQENEKDGSVNITKYLRLVTSLMYLAQFTRPDIFMSVTYLATMSASNPR
jgi:hypothetical protein